MHKCIWDTPCTKAKREPAHVSGCRRKKHVGWELPGGKCTTTRRNAHYIYADVNILPYRICVHLNPKLYFPSYLCNTLASSSSSLSTHLHFRFGGCEVKGQGQIWMINGEDTHLRTHKINPQAAVEMCNWYSFSVINWLLTCCLAVGDSK